MKNGLTGCVGAIIGVSAGGRGLGGVTQQMNYYELMGGRQCREQERGKCQLGAFH